MNTDTNNTPRGPRTWIVIDIDIDIASAVIDNTARKRYQAMERWVPSGDKPIRHGYLCRPLGRGAKRVRGRRHPACLFARWRPLNDARAEADAVEDRILRRVIELREGRGYIAAHEAHRRARFRKNFAKAANDAAILAPWLEQDAA